MNAGVNEGTDNLPNLRTAKYMNIYPTLLFDS